MSIAGRRGNADIRYRAEAELLAKYGELSCRQMRDKLFEEYGIKVSHAQVNQDLKQDLDALTTEDIEDKKSGMLGELEDTINAALNISKTDENNNTRLKAMDTYNHLVKTQAEILRKFEELKLHAREVEKPVYNLTIEKPKIITKKDKQDGRK